MGMFDYIYCKKPLPLSEELKALPIKWSETQFQTKDLDNCLGQYVITENGDLIEEIIEYEHVYYTKEELKTLTPRPWNVVKNSVEIGRKNNVIPFHGKIGFYDIIEFSQEHDIWIDFDAYFIYGKLDKIELVKSEKHTSSKIRMEEWSSEVKKQQSDILYKIKKTIGWFWLWKKVSKGCYRTGRIFDELNLIIIKHMLK